MNSSKTEKLRVGITMGDINGIGPEILIKAFHDPRLREVCVPVIYGSSRVINIYRKILKINKFHYIVVNKAKQAQYRKLNVIECGPDMDRIDVGKPSEMGGKAAFMAIKRALEDAKHRELDVLVTMPVDKATFQMQDESFVGHTELLTKAFGIHESLMLMVSDELRIGVVTNHLPIRNISRNLSTKKIVQKVTIMDKTLKQDFSIQRPIIALLGLNPHAGDQGLIGREEQEVILPAVQSLQKSGILVQGPFPADGFFGSLAYRKFDGVMAMYHDQGLVPFKLISGYAGVNFTAGIPFIRTSPDHGVAYDIAGKDLANTESFLKSLYLAIDVFRTRESNIDLQKNALQLTADEMLKKLDQPTNEKEGNEFEAETDQLNEAKF